ncbi:MAG: hypothetical protein Q7R41_02190 [Phycisphaerales bacterium]|nr:hypothetical protein [Phycisphaerales bacterium]
MDERRIDTHSILHRTVFALTIMAAVTALGGCEPSYLQLRKEGQIAMINGQYGPARYMLLQTEKKGHRRVENLHDLGACSVMLAKEKFAQMNHAAAFRELDVAIDYYSRAIEEHPGHQASLEGKNIALELKGQFEKALQHAEWAAEFVGPSAKQYLFLADEFDQRGDLDGAFLRYRQAVAVEPKNGGAHAAFAKFLLRNENDRAALFHLAEANRLNPKDKWVAEQLATHSLPPETKLASH